MTSTDTTNSSAFDAGTATTALLALARAIGLPFQPLPGNAEQEYLLEWLAANHDEVDSLRDMLTKVSNSDVELNKFLVANGYEPMFEPIDPSCWGAAAILKMAIKWACEASLGETMHLNPVNGKWTSYKAFVMPPEGFEIFKVPGTPEPLVKINGQDGSAAWLLISEPPVHVLDLMKLSLRAMAEKARVHRDYSRLYVPCTTIEAEVPMDWMLGAAAGDQRIAQAFQMISVELDENGAEVKAMSGFATSRSITAPVPLFFDRPFAGWFTQRGSDLPIAAFYSGPDSWELLPVA